jgi:hypothetical protein
VAYYARTSVCVVGGGGALSSFPHASITTHTCLGALVPRTRDMSDHLAPYSACKLINASSSC